MTMQRFWRLRWALLLTAAAVGALFCLLADKNTSRVVGSYVGGVLLAAGAFEFGHFNIRLVGRYAPELTMVVALATYLTTAIALALVLAASSPRVVSGPGIAIGLFVGVTLWLAALIAGSWVRRDSPREPVNIRAQDETNTSSRVGRR